MSIEDTDKRAAASATAARVTLDDIESSIGQVAYMNGAKFLSHAEATLTAGKSHGVLHASVLTICMIVMKNGYMVLGRSAPASPENFDAKLGQRLAYEDCVRQIWPLMGYELRSHLHNNQGDK